MSYIETIDLHGETKDSAKRVLQSKLKSLPKDTRQLVVIHGYHSGNALKDIVRSFSHPRVERKSIGLNQGETILIIRNMQAVKK